MSATEQNRKALEEIHAERVARGVCRHCGGPLPCSSYFGDQRVGVRHSDRTHNALRARRGQD